MANNYNPSAWSHVYDYVSQLFDWGYTVKHESGGLQPCFYDTCRIVEENGNVVMIYDDMNASQQNHVHDAFIIEFGK